MIVAGLMGVPWTLVGLFAVLAVLVAVIFVASLGGDPCDEGWFGDRTCHCADAIDHDHEDHR